MPEFSKNVQVDRQTIQTAGFVASLLYPVDREGPRPVVIVLGGGEGGLKEGVALALARNGFAALALAYFGRDKLPRELVQIPLEYFGRAIGWLKLQPGIDADKIAVMGSSKGGELALLLATAYNEDIRTVVGYVPSGIVWQGISFNHQKSWQGPKSSWTLENRPVPFLRYSTYPSALSIGTSGYFFGKPIPFKRIFESALINEPAVAKASIPVERINGPVFLISGSDDQLWPSTRLSNMVVERLADHNYPFAYEHLNYAGAGHAIGVPGVEPVGTRAGFLDLGGSVEANRYASEDSWEKVLVFLKKCLQ